MAKMFSYIIRQSTRTALRACKKARLFSSTWSRGPRDGKLPTCSLSKSQRPDSGRILATHTLKGWEQSQPFAFAPAKTCIFQPIENPTPGAFPPHEVIVARAESSLACAQGKLE